MRPEEQVNFLTSSVGKTFHCVSGQTRGAPAESASSGLQPNRQVAVKLSVILPCYNGAATIAVQLDALTRQHWPGSWEIIVVNNGSTDSSMEIVDRYRARLPPLAIIEAHVPGTRRLGVPHSYNVGIGAAPL
jgi:cellulose synthase/poly-beta-1,6-N-acetylglucosamine synthase-like glycosyltransferase